MDREYVFSNAVETNTVRLTHLTSGCQSFLTPVSFSGQKTHQLHLSGKFDGAEHASKLHTQGPGAAYNGLEWIFMVSVGDCAATLHSI